MVARYQFLTEKEAECEGVFTQRFQEEKQQRDKPQPHHVAKSYSALDFSHPASSLAGQSVSLGASASEWARAFGLVD